MTERHLHFWSCFRSWKLLSNYSLKISFINRIYNFSPLLWQSRPDNENNNMMIFLMMSKIEIIFLNVLFPTYWILIWVYSFLYKTRWSNICLSYIRVDYAYRKLKTIRYHWKLIFKLQCCMHCINAKVNR